MQKKNETVNNDIARLKGARFVAAIEMEEGKRMAEALIKSVTGGDKLVTRFLTQLQQNERELAGLAMQHLITEAAFRKEQQAIKAQIAALMEKINDQNEKHVRESDFEIITEFDATKVEKFITKVIMSRNVVTFVFYNGAKISKAYSNGQPGNKPGWNKKEA